MTGGRKRVYTPADKAHALAHLAACKGCVAEAARTSGVPRKTLTDWQAGRGVTIEVKQMLEHSKKELAGRFMQEAREAVAAAGNKRENASYRDLMIGAGVAVDKAQLLAGEPTQIFQTIDALAKQRAIIKRTIDSFCEKANARARELGEPEPTREQVIAALVERFPQWADMFASAEAPCALCGAVGHARAELAEPPPVGGSHLSLFEAPPAA